MKSERELQVKTLEAQLMDCRSQLEGYQKIEQELDDIVMQSAQCKYLASERSERDTLRGNAIEISLYLFIWYVGPLFPPGLLIVKRDELRVSHF